MRIDKSLYTSAALPSSGLSAASARSLALGLSALAASAIGCSQGYTASSTNPTDEFAVAESAGGDVDSQGDDLVPFEGMDGLVPDIGFPNYSGMSPQFETEMKPRPEAVAGDCLTTYTGWRLPLFGTCKAGGSPNANGCNGWQPQTTQLPSSLCGDGSGVGVAVAQALKATMYTKTVGTKTGAVLLRGDNTAAPPEVSLYGTIFWDTGTTPMSMCFFDLTVEGGPGISYPAQVGGAGGLTTPEDTGADCPSCHVTNLAAPLKPLYLDTKGTRTLLSLFNTGKAEAAAGTPFTNNQIPTQTGANPPLRAYSTILASKPLLTNKSCNGPNCHASWNMPSDPSAFNGGVFRPALTKPNGSMSNMIFLSVADCNQLFGWYGAPGAANFCKKLNVGGMVKNDAAN